MEVKLGIKCDFFNKNTDPGDLSQGKGRNHGVSSGFWSDEFWRFIQERSRIHPGWIGDSSRFIMLS